MSAKNRIPCGQDGEGKFSTINVGCFDVSLNATSMVLAALEHIPFCAYDGVPFCICDYGTADGGASLSLIQDCIKYIKERYGSGQQVSVVYEDQPGNDFNSLFMKIQGLSPGTPTYYQKYPDVYVSAVGTSFYNQCVPSNSVHLAFSSTAFHWLSKRPALLDDAPFHLYSKDSRGKQIFADQAAEDWEVILLKRAQELKAGGRFIVTCLCVDDNGSFASGKTPSAKGVLFEQLLSCWNKMAAEGKISKADRQNCQFDTYMRTEAEFRAPFQPGCSVYDAGLRLVSYHTKLTRCPFHVRWMAHGNKDDPEAVTGHTKLLVSAVRTWSGSTFLSALQDSYSKEEKNNILDDLYTRLEERVMAAPDDYAQDFVHAYIEIEKLV